MRVKVTGKRYGIEKFEFGKKYCVAYAGITAADVFVFTRKNMIEMCDYQGDKKVASCWISKSELKRMLKAGVIRFISEV